MTSVAGTGGLVRLILRRDRVILPVWMLVVVGTVLQWIATAATVYPDDAARQARLQEVASTPMFLLFQGRLLGSDLGAILVQRAAPVALMVAALGAALLVARHTRAEEQAGRLELLRSTVVGRHAPLTAVLVVMLACGLVTGAVCAAALTGAGFPVAGSVSFGLVVASGIWVTAATTSVLVQLTASARAAAIAAFGLHYLGHLVRGIGAMGGAGTAWLLWSTPSGWLESARPYAGERWDVFALVAGWTALLVLVAYLLDARRDLGAGALPARQGPSEAAPRLRGPVGLAWRLQRTMLVVWVAAAVAFGAALGAVGAEAMTEYARSPWVLEFAAAIGAETPAEALFTYVVGAMAIVVGMYAVMATLWLRAEETRGGAETVLAAPVTRTRWLAAHAGLAVGGTLLILLGLGAGLGLGSGLAQGDPADVMRMLGLTVRYAPATWVIAGVVVAAFGLLPRAAVILGWAGLAVGVAAEVAVKAAAAPDWVFRALSPFAHVSPAYGPTPMSYAVVTLVAAALLALGAVAFRRRDLVT